MSVLIVFLTIVEVLCAFLLVLLVLLQRSKDEGLGMAFGNAMGESLFGAQAATILTKGTVILAVVFMINTVMLDRLYSRRAVTSGIRERLNEQPAAAPSLEAQPMPSAEEAQPAAPAETALPAVSPAASEAAPVAPPAAAAPAAVPATPAAAAPVAVPQT